MGRLAAALAGLSLAGAILAPTALGHASFVGGEPAPGTRLESAPGRVTLAFSEGLNRHLSHASLVDASNGRAVPAARRFQGSRRLALVLARPLRRGAYRVDWQSVSTADGHLLEGSFGFGVQAAAATASGSIERSPLAGGGWARALVRWALYAALLLFAGGLLTRALLGRRWPAAEEPSPAPAPDPAEPLAAGPPGAPSPSGNGRAPALEPTGGGGVAVAAPPRVAAGSQAPPGAARAVAARADAVLADAGIAALALAAVAAGLDAALAAGHLSASALHDYLLANFSGVARIAVVALVGLALALARRAPRAAALAAAAGLAAVVASGHANSADPRGVAIVADVVHLIAAAVWLGGAAILVLAWGPALREAGARQLLVRRVLPRFGRVALTAFGGVVVAGVVNAVVEVGRVAALWETTYGAVLLAKIALVGLVAAAAWTHAFRRDRPHWRALRAEPLFAVGVVGAAAFLVAFPLPPRQADQAARQVGRLPACTSCPLPTPAADELSVGAQAGSQTVATWVRRRGHGLTGTVRALDFRGRPARSAPRVPGAATVACGPGCVTFALASAPPTLRVLVAERGRSFAAGLPVRWDPAGAGRARELVNRGERTMRALRSVVEDERVTSGPGTLAIARYRLRAPDRVAYRTAAGAESVQIGGRQWVRVGGGPWAETPAPGGLPFRTSSWFRWTPYARSVALLGQTGGVARIALMDPGTPVWVRLWIGRRTGRVLREELVAPARLILHRFHSFDRPVTIRAPRGAIHGD